ncbi:hypothetical protein [Bacteroides acidifaciens]|jgi:sec-independent protein translocase protein TatC|uniref:hypothetical protein n=2 Tax=Bacteroides TaxID=816 RepID=UPI0025B213A1|nr:hypothetical protein [Bacteroides acidifaciens]
MYIRLSLPHNQNFVVPYVLIGNPDFMHCYCKYTFVTIFVVVAIIPTSDVFTLSLVALPMWLLYEMSIWIVKNSDTNEITIAT